LLIPLSEPDINTVVLCLCFTVSFLCILSVSLTLYINLEGIVGPDNLIIGKRSGNTTTSWGEGGEVVVVVVVVIVIVVVEIHVIAVAVVYLESTMVFICTYIISILHCHTLS